MNEQSHPDIEVKLRQFTSLVLALRIAVGIIVVLSALRCASVLASIPRFQELFRDLLEGQPLPSLTFFFLQSHRWLLIGISLLAIGSNVTIIISRKVWPVISGIVVVLLCLTVSEMATAALLLPLVQIISAMSGR